MIIHACCGPCSLAAIKAKGLFYFYNPNIWPYEEYMKRLRSFIKVAKHFKLRFIAEIYTHAQYIEEHKKWLEFIVKNIKYPYQYGENSERCKYCIIYRLNKIAKFNEEFTTTLTSGKEKDLDFINNIAGSFQKYQKSFFRKKGGWNFSVRLSKYLKLHRQTYCGCEFSINKNNK